MPVSVPASTFVPLFIGTYCSGEEHFMCGYACLFMFQSAPMVCHHTADNRPCSNVLGCKKMGGHKGKISLNMALIPTEDVQLLFFRNMVTVCVKKQNNKKTVITWQDVAFFFGYFPRNYAWD